MATNFVQPGDTIEWTNTGTAVSAGDFVVIGKQMGVAAVDIAQNATGTVYTEGVFTAPKVSAAVIAKGENVIWDTSAGGFEDNLATPATGDVSGCCIAWAAAGNGVTTIPVKLNVGIGTVA